MLKQIKLKQGRNTTMKEVLKTIISNLVDNEEAVEINQIDSEKSITFEVKVAEADMVTNYSDSYYII